MVDVITDIITRMALIVTTYSPKYPVFIPFDVYQNGLAVEKILSIAEESPSIGLPSGYTIRDEQTQELKIFGDLLELAHYLYNDINPDLDMLLERSDTYLQMVAALNQINVEKINDVMEDPEYTENAVANRRLIESALREREDKDDPMVREEFLFKKTPKELEDVDKFKLSLVEEDETDD